ncbi:MAG: flagellar protein FliS [Sphingomonas bacterium]|jgi:flagellar protein FliS|nr:flagellar protein FliS [Sphingomonas bacterium]MDB5718249.1 flagellar protein FliS [Sphingomonas bacterium]
MYARPIRAGGAGAHYRAVDVSSKIEGASPHRLVAILYEELILALAGMKTAIRRGDAPRQNEAQARAMAIVQSLDAGLDFTKGGEIARALSSVYAEVGRLTAIGGSGQQADAIDRAQALIAEIAEAWNQIG